MTDEKEFDRLFDVAELCNFTPEQYSSYQNSQKMIYDYENTIDFARKQGEAKGRKEGGEEGFAEGQAKGREEIAKKMKEAGMPIEQIADLTGLPDKQIHNL